MRDSNCLLLWSYPFDAMAESSIGIVGQFSPGYIWGEYQKVPSLLIIYPVEEGGDFVDILEP